MKSLSDILADKKSSGLYALSGAPRIQALREQCEESGRAFFHLNLEGIDSKERFMDLCAGVFNLPDYFGRNWDALEDCLKDMRWIKADGFVILYENFGALAERATEDFEESMEILSDAAEYWSENDKPMLALLRGEPATELESVTC
jgi:RNAse (barnase) inhibitor barstar